jgi:hypothetical protein
MGLARQPLTAIAPVLDKLRTFSARIITRHGIGPRSLQIRAWAWSVAETDDLAEQKRCLEAIVALDPSLDWAQAALTRVWYHWRRENQHGYLAYALPTCAARLSQSGKL